MDTLLKHIVPFSLMLAGIGVCFVLEFLLKKQIILKESKIRKTILNLSVLASLLVSTGMLVFLVVIGAGMEIMLPSLLLILLGAMI